MLRYIFALSHNTSTLWRKVITFIVITLGIVIASYSYCSGPIKNVIASQIHVHFINLHDFAVVLFYRLFRTITVRIFINNLHSFYFGGRLEKLSPALSGIVHVHRDYFLSKLSTTFTYGLKETSNYQFTSDSESVGDYFVVFGQNT
jgi:hypothetical protein